MKGRDSRKQTLIVASAAIAGGVTFGAILGIAAVAPFAASKGSDLVEGAIADARTKHAAGIPAAKAKKAELDALNKEKKQLDKDKKALEKKIANARKQQAKKIYQERVAHGYEASIPALQREADKAAALAAAENAGKKKKAKKVKKSKKTAPIVLTNEAAPVLAKPVEEATEPQFESASMFKGISF